MANRPEPEIEITQPLVRALLRDQCPALADLDLSNCLRLQRGAAELGALTALRALSLARCVELRAADVTELVRRSASLRELNVAHCPQLVDCPEPQWPE